jgi:hypothetical protein
VASLRVIIATSHVNRHGEVRGGEEYAHEADVVINVEAM